MSGSVCGRERGERLDSWKSAKFNFPHLFFALANAKCHKEICILSAINYFQLFAWLCWLRDNNFFFTPSCSFFLFNNKRDKTNERDDFTILQLTLDHSDIFGKGVILFTSTFWSSLYFPLVNTTTGHPLLCVWWSETCIM